MSGKKTGFYIPEELLKRMRDRVNSMRSAPHNLTLNAFVVLAVERELERSQAKVRLEPAGVRAERKRAQKREAKKGGKK
jgi:hypothetical protein